MLDSYYFGPPSSTCMAGHGIYLFLGGKSLMKIFVLPCSPHAPPIGLYGDGAIRDGPFFSKKKK